MNVEARVEPLTGGLPAIAWRWDPETDILSGAFKGNRKSGGLTGTVELTDAEGLGRGARRQQRSDLRPRRGGVARGDHQLEPADPRAADRRTRGAALSAVQTGRRLHGGGHDAVGRDQRLRRACSTSASVRVGPSRSSAWRTTSTSRWTSRAASPASGWPTSRRSRRSKTRCKRQADRAGKARRPTPARDRWTA